MLALSCEETFTIYILDIHSAKTQDYLYYDMILFICGFFLAMIPFLFIYLVYFFIKLILICIEP